MNNERLAELLSTVLENQLESGDRGSISMQRLRESMTIGPGLTKNERKLLLLSPVARADYQRVSVTVQNEIKDRLAKNSIAIELLPLAAATDDDKVFLKGEDFDVILIKKEELGIPWVILVQLGSSYQRTINPMTVLRLVDSGGLEWLRGKPDSNGELTAAWYDNETDLISRARRFTLFLEPA